MSEPPETIWAWAYHDDDESLVDLGEWYTEDAGLDGDETPYIRADLHEARIEELEAKAQALTEVLNVCRDQLDTYCQGQYQSNHPFHIAGRKRAYDANPARVALAALKGQDDE